MKKILSISLIALMVISLSSCNWFKNESESDNKTEITIEDLVCEDTKYMVENYDTSFVYYETEIILNDFLDEECDGSFETVTNIFQTFADNDTLQKPTVFMFIHEGDSTQIENVTGYWLEDIALRDGDIVINYKDAYQKLIETNFPKPHAKTCTLRNEVGPCPSNAQYIFGDIDSQLYVDAITGDVLENSPAFDCNKTENEEVVPQQ